MTATDVTALVLAVLAHAGWISAFVHSINTRKYAAKAGVLKP